jgi:hypothetical protein
VEPWELAAREAIRDSIALYTQSGDRLRLDELASAFCADGVLEIRGEDPLAGRAAIVAGLGGRPHSPDETAPKRIVRHNIANVRFVSITPDEAQVESYFTVLTEIGLDHFGRYRDTFVPAEGRWLIRHRFVSVDWFAPASRFRRSPAPS